MRKRIYSANLFSYLSANLAYLVKSRRFKQKKILKGAFPANK